MRCLLLLLLLESSVELTAELIAHCCSGLLKLTSELLSGEVVASAVAMATAPHVAVDLFLDQLAAHLDLLGRTWKLQKYFLSC